MITLGERIKQLRDSKQLSQDELAKVFNLSQSTIAYYETNKKQPPLQTLQTIADFFHVSTDYLLGRTDNKNEKLSQEEQKSPKDLQKFLDQQGIMFDGVPLTDDDKEKICKALEIIFWDAKQQNKRKKV